MVTARRTAAALTLAAASAAAAATAFVTPPPPPHQCRVLDRAGPFERLAALRVATRVDVPPFVESPILAQVYPALLAHLEAHGHVDIPLGGPDGARCRALRRLHFQGRLSDREVALLTELGFRFNAFEDVYRECDFGEMLGKMVGYREEFGTYQIPKKYAPDPELGAYVTMLRRLRKMGELPRTQVDALDAVGFEWVSTRRCGSPFMRQYRELAARVNEAGGDAEDILQGDADLARWLHAQRRAHERGDLATSRVKYLDELLGADWRRSEWA